MQDYGQQKTLWTNHIRKRFRLTGLPKQTVSRFHFSRLFKATYHCTPHAYLTQVRIRESQRLLRNNFSVKDACFGIGFSSTNSFKLLFKRYTRQTPFAYLRNLRGTPQNKNVAVLILLPYLKKSNFQVSVPGKAG